MSTTNGEAPPANNTNGDAQRQAEAAPKVPERSEVLKAFAREAMGEPEPAAPVADAAGPNADEALSQAAAPQATAGETPEEKAAREAAESDAEAKAEAEAGLENHLEDELRQELPEEVQEKINRRIGKEVGKTKAEREARETAEARVAELENQLAQAPNATPQVQSFGPLGDVHDIGKLNGKKVEAEAAFQQADELLSALEDGDAQGVEQALRSAKIELKDETGEDDFSEARMKKWLRAVRGNADRMLRTAIPKREEFLKTAEVNAKSAVDLMPELKDAKGERRKLFNQVLREFPEVQKTADWPLKAIAAVIGLEWLKKQAEAKVAANGTQPKVKREVPVVIPTPRAQPPRVVAKQPDKVDANAFADAVLSGDKSARLKLLTGLVSVK